MKHYETPEMEILRFSVADILSGSGFVGGDDGPGDDGNGNGSTEPTPDPDWGWWD